MPEDLQGTTLIGILTLIITHTITLLFGVLGLKLRQRMQLRGKIQFRVDEWKCNLVMPNDLGEEMPVSDLTRATGGKGWLKVGIWSYKGARTALHEVRVEFKKGRETVLSVQPYDNAGWTGRIPITRNLT